jgi:hypothetical protein
VEFGGYWNDKIALDLTTLEFLISLFGYIEKKQAQILWACVKTIRIRTPGRQVLDDAACFWDLDTSLMSPKFFNTCQ